MALGMSGIQVLALWAAGLGVAGQFAKLSVAFPEFQAAYPEAGVWAGFAVSILSLLGIILGLSAGLVVARIGFRRLLIGALLLGAVISLYQASLPPLPILMATRAVEGLSHLIVVVAAPTLIGQVAAPQWRGAAMTLWSSFFGVSFAIVAWLGLPMVTASGIGALFAAHGVYMAAVAVLLLIVLPSKPVQNADLPRLSLRRIVAQHGEVYRSANAATPALGWLFYTLTFVSLLTVLPGYVAADQRAFVVSAMPLAGIAVSLTLGVGLLRAMSAVTVVQLGFGLSALIMAGLILLPGQAALCIGLMGALGLVQGASFAAVPQLNPTPDGQARANGAMAQMGNLGNTCGTPLLLAVGAAFGFAGVGGVVIGCFAAGMALHLWQSRRRAATAIG